MLGHGQAVSVRSVHHHNPVGTAVVQINAVHSNSVLPNHLQLGVGRQYIGIQSGYPHDDSIAVLQICDQILLADTACLFDLKTMFL